MSNIVKTTPILTPPLTRSLGSQELSKHRAYVGLELEVVAKKYDSFGWDKERDTPIHDRIMSDWMDALADFPIDEIKNAIKEFMRDPKNKKRPHEGQIHAIIMKNRAKIIRLAPKLRDQAPERPAPTQEERKRMEKYMHDNFPNAV